MIKRIFIVSIAIFGILITICALFKLPVIYYKPHITLGLDLNGGSSVTFDLDQKDLLYQEYKTAFDKYVHMNTGNANDILDVEQDNISANEKYIINDQYIKVRKDLFSTVDSDILDMTRDNDYVILTFNKHYIQSIIDHALNRSIEVIRNRIDTGGKECNIYQEGKSNIVVEMPGIDNPQELKDLIGKTAKLTFAFQTDDINAYKRKVKYEERDILVEDDILDGRYLTNASVSSNTGICISFSFNREGASRFYDITKNNIGRYLAILLDDEVLSIAEISTPIGGAGMISGNFTYEQAQNIALLMRSGSLPAKLTPISEYKIGPALGQEEINNSIYASILSLFLISIFMSYVYGMMGILSIFILLINCAMILAFMIITDATLTLPGIAGLVITMGMSVDSNILINERIRENKNPKSALAIINGYKNAMPAILDSNITTLIGAVIIYISSSGFIKGFAVTLSAGIMISMFTSIILSRTILSMFKNIEYRI